VTRPASLTDGAAVGQPFELAAGVLGLFTGRAGGVSEAPYDSLNMSGSVGDDPAAVRRNRELVAAACGLSVAAMAWMHQVHGCAVTRIAAGDLPMALPRGDFAFADAAQTSLPRCDALLTDAPGTALIVLAADCAPVLVADPAARMVGAAHAGREGLAAGVVPALVAQMSAAGAEPGRMRAVLGPAICGGCYAVPARLRDRVAAAVPEASCRTRAGTPGIDIRAGLRAQLRRSGVRLLSADRRCTAEAPGLFSYRRDGRTGRFAALIWIAD
jgi:YfiH family protein